MTYYDPLEHLDEDDRADWVVRQHLYAKRRLAEMEERGWRRGQLFDEAQHGDRCHRRGCSRPGRVIPLTGDVICAEHDPLRRCDARHGGWGCSATFVDHPWPHRFMTLLEEGDRDG